MRLTWEQAISSRFRRQHLVERAPKKSMLDVAGTLGGVHAQLMSSAELTLWARVEGLTAADTAAALWQERSLFKTWAMRGTLHLLPSSEYGMWQGGWATYDHFLKGAWFKAFGMSREALEQVIDAVGESLLDRVLTREELADAVVERTGAAELGEKLRQSWGSLLKPASFRGRLCFGPNRGRNVAFTSPQTWLGGPAPMPGQEALEAITRRFLRANGPATREDFARWWFMPPARAGRLLDRLGDEAALVDVEGTPYRMLAEDLDEAQSAPAARGVKLLPGFDQYVIAATLHAERLMSGPFKPRIYRPQGWISPVLLVDGRMEGVWQHAKKSGRLVVSVEPFVPLSQRVTRAVAAEAESLARFLALPDVAVEYSA